MINEHNTKGKSLFSLLLSNVSTFDRVKGTKILGKRVKRELVIFSEREKFMQKNKLFKDSHPLKPPQHLLIHSNRNSRCPS